jgi:predicted DNA-binding protein YlxM (UPF0122 family)
MANKATTREMIKLYENGMTLQEIGDLYGISRQRVQQRFEDADATQFERPPKYTLINKDHLETFYVRERLSIAKIGDAFEVKSHLILQALEFHKIPKRCSINSSSKYVDRLRELKIGKKIEIDCPAKKPYVVLHKSAKIADSKISVKKLGDGKFQIMRIF